MGELAALHLWVALLEWDQITYHLMAKVKLEPEG